MSKPLEIADLRAELIRHRHFTRMASESISQLATRLRNRLTNDMDSMPGDRAALLDADLVMAEAYKLTQEDTHE